MKAKNLILLYEMSHSEAMKLLNMQMGDDPHKAYKEMAKKHHPDRGGSTEMMQKVNQAYEMVKNMRSSSGGYSKEDYQKQKQEYERKQKEKLEKRKIMVKDLESQFSKYIKEYEKHFAPYFKLSKEPKISVDVGSYYYSTGYVKVNWGSEDGKTDIRLIIDIRPESGGSLAAPDSEETQYDIDYRTEVYHARGIHKMSQKRWSARTVSSFVFDPNKVFPESKLKKIIAKPVKKAMRKAEFQKALSLEVSKIGGMWFNDTFLIELGRPDDIVMTMFRTTFRGQSSWYVWYRKAERDKRTGKFWKIGAGSSQVADLPKLPTGFPESSLSIDMLLDLVKMVKAGEKIDQDYFKPAWDSMSESYAGKILRMIEDTVSHEVGLNNTHYHIRTDSNEKDGQWWEVEIYRILDGNEQKFDFKKFGSEQEAKDYVKSNRDKYE